MTTTGRGGKSKHNRNRSMSTAMSPIDDLVPPSEASVRYGRRAKEDSEDERRGRVTKRGKFYSAAAQNGEDTDREPVTGDGEDDDDGGVTRCICGKRGQYYLINHQHFLR